MVSPRTRTQITEVKPDVVDGQAIQRAEQDVVRTYRSSKYFLIQIPMAFLTQLQVRPGNLAEVKEYAYHPFHLLSS